MNWNLILNGVLTIELVFGVVALVLTLALRKHVGGVLSWLTLLAIPCIWILVSLIGLSLPAGN